MMRKAVGVGVLSFGKGVVFGGGLMFGLKADTYAEKIITDSRNALWRIYDQETLGMIKDGSSETIVSPSADNKLDDAEVPVPALKDVVVIQKSVPVANQSPTDDVKAEVASPVAAAPSKELPSVSSSGSSGSGQEPPSPSFPSLTSLFPANSLTVDIAAIRNHPPTRREVDAVAPVMVKVVRNFLHQANTSVEESVVPLAVDIVNEVMLNDSLRGVMLDDIMSEITGNYHRSSSSCSFKKPAAVKNQLSGAIYQPTHSELAWEEIRKKYPCALCQDVLAASTVLDECSHSFCWSCVEELKDRCRPEGDSAAVVVYECPSCRAGFLHNTFQPVVDRDVEELVCCFEGAEKTDYEQRRAAYFRSVEKKLARKLAAAAKKAAEQSAAAAADTAAASEESKNSHHDQMRLVVMVGVVLIMFFISKGRAVWSK